MNVLVSSAGRRGALIRMIRETIQPQGGRVYAVDAAPWSSACRMADGWELVPRFDDSHFFDAVASICHRHDIRLIIPTHDHELPIYAKLSPLFAALNIHVACSGPQTVALAQDKRRTDRFLTAAGLPTVPRISDDRVRQLDPTLPFPLVVKPSHGSASAGVHIAHDIEELAFYLKRTKSPLIQQHAKGREYTTNLFVDPQGRCVVAVPHWRVETRGGEVSKCVTVRKPCLLDLAARLARALPDARGPLCFQAFVDDQDQPQLLEINARFGGGYPVAHQAGANFVQLLIDQIEGRRSTPPTWVDGLAMTRWDDAVFWQVPETQRCA